ncbi:MAG: mntP 1 [Firmicutes bacterium]|nr:mntP 1 [Bacillota bacterium]
MEFLYIFILCIAVSTDGFITGIAYGFKGIILPLRSLFIVSIITASSAAVAMYLAFKIGQFIAVNLAITTGAVLLIILGGINLLREIISNNIYLYHNLTQNYSSEPSSSIGKLLVNIITEPETADIDHSKSISAWEAIFLGLALGLDNMIAIFAASLIGQLPYYTPILMGVIQLVLIATGGFLSSRIVTETLKQPFSYLFGIILICVGLWRLL